MILGALSLHDPSLSTKNHLRPAKGNRRRMKDRGVGTQDPETGLLPKA